MASPEPGIDLPSHVSLFTGCGGLDLGLEAAGWGKPLWFCENDKSCRKVLGEHWPSVPVLADVKDVGGDAIGSSPDLVSGGFP